MPPSGQRMDYEGLANTMAALGYPLRLELLQRLRVPQAMREILVAPQRSQGRVAARQTIEGHLKKLMAAGMVRSEPRNVGGRDVQFFGTDPQQLWGFTEQVRRLTSLHAGQGMPADATQTNVAVRSAPNRPEGPHMVLVHGLHEGRIYPIEQSPLVLGRSDAADVSLDYDAYASLEHAALHRHRKRIWIEDLKSRNGTTVNWQPCLPGQQVDLRSGDIVGIGRSLLCVRA